MWKERKKKNFLAIFLSSPLFLSLVLLGLLAAILSPLHKNMTSRYRIDSEIDELKAEISSLEGGNQDLKKLLSYLQSDQYAETEARLNFGMRKQGEEVVVIKEEDVPSVGFFNKRRFCW
jgi:cell division protein FtsB